MENLLKEMEEAIKNEEAKDKRQEILQQYIFNASLKYRNGNNRDKYIDNIVEKYEKTDINSIADLQVFINTIFSEKAIFMEEQKDIANKYLLSTDWVEPYLIKHYIGIEPLPEDSNKFIIEQKRKEARDIVNV